MPPPLGRFTSASSEPTGDLLVVETEVTNRFGDTLVATEIVPLVDEDRPLIDELVELARVERELRRVEAHERYAVIAIDLEPAPWFARPWARIGAAALLGYALGRSRTLRTLASLTFGAALVMSVDRALTHGEPASTFA
jgi:hypothetical protein